MPYKSSVLLLISSFNLPLLLWRPTPKCVPIFIRYWLCYFLAYLLKLQWYMVQQQRITIDHWHHFSVRAFGSNNLLAICLFWFLLFLCTISLAFHLLFGPRATSLLLNRLTHKDTLCDMVHYKTQTFSHVISTRGQSIWQNEQSGVSPLKWCHKT